LRIKLLDRLSSYLLRIARAIQADLDDLAGYDLANRIIAINQMQPFEGHVERSFQYFGIFRSYQTPLKQAV